MRTPLNQPRVFVRPVVRENPSRWPTTRRPTQRELVTASLLIRPEAPRSAA